MPYALRHRIEKEKIRYERRLLEGYYEIRNKSKRKLTDEENSKRWIIYGFKGRFKKGHIPYSKLHPECMRRGKNNPAWRGGIQNLPYPFDFNEELKNLIRKRDGYKCQLCGCSQIENMKKLSVHHIDYNKKNLNPDNLISLCVGCNSRVNGKRLYWEKKIKEGREVEMAKGKDLTDKGPGDAPDIKNIPEWRGEDGKGGHTTSDEKETSSVNYDK